MIPPESEAVAVWVNWAVLVWSSPALIVGFTLSIPKASVVYAVRPPPPSDGVILMYTVESSVVDRSVAVSHTKV